MYVYSELREFDVCGRSLQITVETTEDLHKSKDEIEHSACSKGPRITDWGILSVYLFFIFCLLKSIVDKNLPDSTLMFKSMYEGGHVTNSSIGIVDKVSI